MMGKYLPPGSPGVVAGLPAKRSTPTQPMAGPPVPSADRGKWVPVLLATNAVLLLALVVALGVIIVLMLYLGKASSVRPGQATSRASSQPVTAAWLCDSDGLSKAFTSSW